MPSITLPATVKTLGYYLYYYLTEKWRVPSDNIAFFSAYCDEDTISGFHKRFPWPIEPIFFDKKDSVGMEQYLSKRFSPNQITDESAIVWARMLYRFWEAKGIPGDSILRRVGKPKKGSPPHTDNEITKKMKSALNEADYRSGQAAYDKILDAASFAFDFDTSLNYEDGRDVWYRKVYEEIKCLRNIYAHQSKINSKLSAIEFLLLFSVILRAIFESTSQPVNDLQEQEKWMMNGLEQIEKQNGVVSRLNKAQLNVRVEETMLQWYLEIETKARFIGDAYRMLCSLRDCTPKDVVQLFCMRAMNAMFSVNPSIGSSFQGNQQDQGDQTTRSPSISCVLESCDNFQRRDLSPVPKVMESFARAYIYSQLTYEMERSRSFKIYL